MITGWWFGAFVPYIGNSRPSLQILFRGVGPPPTRLCLGIFVGTCKDHEKPHVPYAFVRLKHGERDRIPHEEPHMNPKAPLEI